MPNDSPIRLAHLLDGRHFGGAEQIVRRLIETAPAIGVESRAYCLSEGRLAEFLRAQGLDVRVFAASGKFDPRVIPAILRAAREDRLDLIQAHTSRTHLLARFLSTRLSIPNITTIHSPIAQDENRTAARHPLRAWIERLGRPWTDHLVSVSQEERERLIREEGVNPERITWIPNGVAAPPPRSREAARQALGEWIRECGLPAPAVSQLFVAMIAQMRPRKGPEVLIQGFARWLREGGRGLLVMIGDDEFTGGGYLDRLKALARELGVADSIIFTGFMTEPWTLAAGADLVALPSLFGEGLPLVLLEAMSHGIPLLVSDTPGNRELAQGGQRGWVFRPGDATALAEALADAASHPGERAARGSAARSCFEEHFTIGQVQAAYRTLFKRLLKSSRRL